MLKEDPVHTKRVTPEDVDVLKLLQSGCPTALVRIYFNGSQRLGLVALVRGTKKQRQRTRLLAVLPIQEDIILDEGGQAPVCLDSAVDKAVN